MAKLFEINPELQAWIDGRPPKVKAACLARPGNLLYRIKKTGQRCTIYSYGEEKDGTITLTVAITGQFNRVLFSRLVYGFQLDDIEECDLPGPDEELGDTAEEAGYSEEDIKNILIPKMREEMVKNGELIPCTDPNCALGEPGHFHHA